MLLEWYIISYKTSTRELFRKLLDDYISKWLKRAEFSLTAGVTTVKSIYTSHKLQLSMFIITRKNIWSKLTVFVVLSFLFILNTFAVDMCLQGNKYQYAEPASICSKSTLETPEQCVSFLKSYFNMGILL